MAAGMRRRLLFGNVWGPTNSARFRSSGSSSTISPGQGLDRRPPTGPWRRAVRRRAPGAGRRSPPTVPLPRPGGSRPVRPRETSAGQDCAGTPGLGEGHRHAPGSRPATAMKLASPTPAGHAVHVQVVGLGPAGHLAQVDAHVHPVAAHGGLERHHRVADQGPQLDLNSSSSRSSRSGTARLGSTIRWPAGVREPVEHARSSAAPRCTMRVSASGAPDCRIRSNSERPSSGSPSGTADAAVGHPLDVVGAPGRPELVERHVTDLSSWPATSAPPAASARTDADAGRCAPPRRPAG